MVYLESYKTKTETRMTTRAVFDTESDGFLYDATVIWCIVFKDYDTQDVYRYGPDSVGEGLKRLQDYNILIGHNICGHDIPLIKKLYPWWTHQILRDTYCMSKLFNPERIQGHSLESYGDQFHRAKPVHEDWSRFSEEMLYRCSEDVEINWLTYRYLVDKYCKDWKWADALELEQEFAMYQAYQEVAGVDFDLEKARALLERIDKEVDELDATLLQRLPKRVVPIGKPIMKPFKKDGTYIAKVLEYINA